MGRATNDEKLDCVMTVFGVCFFVERAVITLLMFFSLSQLFSLPGISSVSDAFLGHVIDIPLATTFAQLITFAKIEKASTRIFVWERLGFFFAIPYQQFRYSSCLFLSVSIFIVTSAIMLNDDIDQMYIRPATSPDSCQKTHKEANDQLDEKLLGTTEIKKNNSQRKESNIIRDDEMENEAILNREKEENELKKINDVCMINLEEEKNELLLKLEIANEALEYYHGVIKDFTEQSLTWDEEKKVLSQKLEAAAASASTTTNLHQESMKNSFNGRYSRHDDQYDIDDTSYDHDHYESYDNRNLLEEKQELSRKLDNARRALEFYKGCLNDYEEICRNLRIEITEISAKHFAETLSAERYHKLWKELEDKYRKLAEEKDDLWAKLNAAKASAEIYRCFLHDTFLHDYAIVPRV